MAQAPQGRTGKQGQSQDQRQSGGSGAGGGTASDAELQLRDMQFPASREDLRQQAMQNNADGDVLIIIDALPDGRFELVEAVIVALDEARRH